MSEHWVEGKLEPMTDQPPNQPWNPPPGWVYQGPPAVPPAVPPAAAPASLTSTASGQSAVVAKSGLTLAQAETILRKLVGYAALTVGAMESANVFSGKYSGVLMAVGGVILAVDHALNGQTATSYIKSITKVGSHP